MWRRGRRHTHGQPAPELRLASVAGPPAADAAEGRGVGPEPTDPSPREVTVRPGDTAQLATAGVTDVLWGIRETSRPPAFVLPLRVSANGRYLVDQQGRPWRVQADAAWLMSTQATPEEVDRYLAVRSAQGFNSFYLMAIVHPGGFHDVAPDAPADREGNPPFAIPGDFSTAGTTSASRRYWEWIDTIVAKAAARNMVVMLAYTYLGFDGGDMGWYREILGQPTRQALHDWGLWLGKRFAGADNVIWFALGDHAPPEGSEEALRARAIAEGIRAGGARQLFMAEGPPPDSIPTEHGDFSDVLDQSSFYGYGPEGSGTVYETADRAWRQSPARPAWMQEGTYEHENNWGRFSGQPWDTRRGRYWSVLAGGTAGDGFGSRSVWQWIDIPESLSSAGAEYSSHAFELFRSIRWWELRPSGTDPGFAGLELVCSGQGSWGGPDYITSALTARSDWMLAYVPVTRQGSRAFSVTMSALSGRVRARWFDPATGTYLAISDGYSLRNDGTRTFTTPGARKDGTDDWVLILDSTGDARCGWVTRDGLYHAPARFDPDVTCRITVSQTSDLAIVAEAPITPA